MSNLGRGVLALVLACAPAGGLGQGFLDKLEAKGPEGERGSQPVGTANANAELEVILLPQGDRTAAGETYRLDVTVVGDPVRDATNVGLEVAAVVRRGTAAGPADVRIERAVLLAREGQAEKACGGTGASRLCDIGALPAKGEAKASITIRTRPKAMPGQVVLSARALIGGAPRSPQEKVVELVEKAKLSNVGLSVAIASDSDVGAPGLDVGNTVRVRNSSDKEAATDVVVEIRQRISVSESEGFKRLPTERFATKGRHESCAWRELIYRCTLGTLAAGAEVRIPLETVISEDLPARRWGQLETQARVKSAEDDPDPGNNFARQMTRVISRQPELAFISSVRGADGKRVFVRQREVGNAQVFRLAARFPHVLVEPTGELVVRLVIDNSPPVEVRLRRSADGKGVYRSEPFILLAPQDKTEPAGNTALRAARGSVLKVTHGSSEVVVRVE